MALESLRLRPVAEADIAHLCGVPQDARELFFLFPRARYPLTPAQLRAAIAQRADASVVEWAGSVAGFANFYRWEIDGVCAIGNVMVAAAARGRGIGRYLMQEMIALARSKYQAREVRVACFNENTAALVLYTQLGFQPLSIEPRLDPQGRRVALIHLRLSSAAQ